MKHTLKTFLAEQLEERGIEDKYGRYLSQEEIIDDLDTILKDLEQKELLELMQEFIELEYEQNK